MRQLGHFDGVVATKCQDDCVYFLVCINRQAKCRLTHELRQDVCAHDLNVLNSHMSDFTTVAGEDKVVLAVALLVLRKRVVEEGEVPDSAEVRVAVHGYWVVQVVVALGVFKN